MQLWYFYSSKECEYFLNHWLDAKKGHKNGHTKPPSCKFHDFQISLEMSTCLYCTWSVCLQDSYAPHFVRRVMFATKTSELQKTSHLSIANDWCQLVRLSSHQEGDLIQNVNVNTCNSPVKCLDLKRSIIICKKINKEIMSTQYLSLGKRHLGVELFRLLDWIA